MFEFPLNRNLSLTPVIFYAFQIFNLKNWLYICSIKQIQEIVSIKSSCYFHSRKLLCTIQLTFVFFKLHNAWSGKIRAISLWVPAKSILYIWPKFSFKIRREHQKNFIWALRLWVDIDVRSLFWIISHRFTESSTPGLKGL